MGTAARDSALATIAGMPTVMRALAAGREPAVHGFNADWGLAEVVAHLLDVSDIAFVTRIRRCIEEDSPLITPIDPPARLAAGGYLGRGLDSLLDQWAAQRATDVAWLRSQPLEALARTATHAEAGTVSADNFLHYWAVHELAHLRQAAAALQQEVLPAIGNTAKFLAEV